MADKLILLVAGSLFGAMLLTIFHAVAKRRAYKEVEVKNQTALMEQAHALAKKEIEAEIKNASPNELADLGNKLVEDIRANSKNSKS